MTGHDEGTPVTGGCCCGAVRYSARVHLDQAYYCHCKLCRRSSGAPAEVAVPVVPGSLEWTKGAPRFWQSSPFGERGFCAVCGGRLIWQHVGGEQPELTNLSVGSLDDPAGVTTTEHLCVESQLPWYRPDEHLPRRRSDELPGLQALWRAARDQA